MRSIGQHAHETGYVWARRLVCERIFRREFDDVARGTDHDLAFKGQLPNKGAAKNRFRHIFADRKGADGADVHDTELSQLLREYRRLASISSTDVHCTKKDDPAHCNDLTAETFFSRKPPVHARNETIGVHRLRDN